MDSEHRRAMVVAHLELAFAAITRGVESGWIDQDFSPLGPRQHCAAVKRRLAERQPGAEPVAFIVGLSHYLSLDAVAEEYFRHERDPRVRGLTLCGVAPANGNAEAQS
jgi:hypothetical protein